MTKHKIPTTVHVAPYDVTIGHLTGEEAAKNFGMFVPEHMAIRIRSEFSTPQQAADTVLHEVLHAVWQVAGLSPKDSEERIVATLSTSLCGLIQRNEHLVDWLVAALKTQKRKPK